MLVLITFLIPFFIAAGMANILFTHSIFLFYFSIIPIVLAIFYLLIGAVDRSIEKERAVKVVKMKRSRKFYI